MPTPDDPDSDLLRSAAQKKRTGGKLIRAEQAAWDRANVRALNEQLRKLTPKHFCDLFGIQHNQRNQWEEQLGIPCGKGRESIDLFAVAAIIRKICSRRVGLATDSPELAVLRKTKLNAEIDKLQEQKIQLRMENEFAAGRRLPRESIIKPLERMAGILRSLGDRLARRNALTGREAQALLNHALDQYERELNAIGETDASEE